MTPYFTEGEIVIYHGDCREMLTELALPPVCVTDPVWPNSVFPDVADPHDLFSHACRLMLAGGVERLVAHLGCTSDPRFLDQVPPEWPFIRACWLRYARPSYRGRILVGSDVAYVFGAVPPSRPGRRVLSGETVACNNTTKHQHTGRGMKQSGDVDYAALPHPCPRRLEHVAWLVGIYGDGGVIDPFMGTGTTLEAAKRIGLPCIGIDIMESNCEIAAERLRQGALFGSEQAC